MTETETINAYVWAAKVANGAVPIMHLNKGDKFRWPNKNNPIKVYRGRGWYRVVSCTGELNKCYRTGMKTAVVKVEEES